MAVNPLLVNRLESIRAGLMSSYRGGGGLSSATKGMEREHFLNNFLKEVMPPSYRFGCGDITDSFGNKSGQVDVVIENAYFPSLTLSVGGPRLYLAESVAAALEVKSDISSQWSQLHTTATALKSLRRYFAGGTVSFGSGPPTSEIPLFAVGYTGWQSMAPLEEKVEAGLVDGILVIDPGLFASNKKWFGIRASGPQSLLGLMMCLTQATTTLISFGAASAMLEYVKK